MDKKRIDLYKESEIGSMFLDSGAFGLYTRVISKMTPEEKRKYLYKKDGGHKQYLDLYVEFVKAHEGAFDYVASVDVISDFETSWRNLKYLESKGLSPVPVLHYNCKRAELEKYLESGYKMLGLGGMVNASPGSSHHDWLDDMFEIICDPTSGEPCVKVHGFALTGWSVMSRYPWYSVDSATWVKAAGFGDIIVPKKKNGQFSFSVRPWRIPVSIKSGLINKRNGHINNIPKAAKNDVMQWLEFIGVPLGVGAAVKTDVELSENLFGAVHEVEKEMKVWGVATHREARAYANLKYFEAFANYQSSFQTTFKPQRRATLWD